MCSDIHELSSLSLSLSFSLSSLQQTKVYQHSCHNTAEAHNKLVKCKEKVDGSRGAARKKKAQEKELEVSERATLLLGRTCLVSQFGQVYVHPLPYNVFMSWLALVITSFVQH